ncbi:MAG TPA: hypothetical protein VJG49_04565 [Candidatus Nanoarchaeia archaeon]|nr:hypothetical protein [Candidatus Nanoarchaeia archaeon]
MRTGLVTIGLLAVLCQKAVGQDNPMEQIWEANDVAAYCDAHWDGASSGDPKDFDGDEISDSYFSCNGLVYANLSSDRVDELFTLQREESRTNYDKEGLVRGWNGLNNVIRYCNTHRGGLPGSVSTAEDFDGDEIADPILSCYDGLIYYNPTGDSLSNYWVLVP